MALRAGECYTLRMDVRQSKLLVAIIDQFIETALPVGSKRLLEAGDFCCSSATLRSEMVDLEDEGFLEQPHVSAGRVPTAKGYRLYARELLEPSRHELAVRRKFETLKDHYFKRKDQERVYEAVSLLAHMIPDVAFAKVPHKSQVYYLGLSNVFKQPEFQGDPKLASGVAEALEEHMHKVLSRLELTDDVRYYIGDEHLLPQIQSCSMLVTRYQVRGEAGIIGILGPMRMDYAYNTVALELVAGLLRS
ncbi:MAG: hypothetical protein PHO54_03185 [Candidatus Peribacteraceae bacterium]|nr:hypothetical protein [Candidatus Peribacteraceae bacterium]